MKDLPLDTQVKLKKDLPDLRASEAPTGQVFARDEDNRKFILIKKDEDIARDGWFYFLDEIIDFDNWFEVIN